VGRRGAVAVKSTAVVRPVRPWVPQPYYGTVFDGVHWAPSSPQLLRRRHRLSTCAGIGRIPLRLAAIGISANSSIVHDLPQFSGAK
jgi:hypothetical protein